ncbi:phenylalanyl-tRNA synthetase subunit alpha [Formosa agariphila KMM 3901]|uniref:Phenylalanyl-tRNA synthetase subunit alpha n=1 Tax=Formosa agariphila (strain DSM 15362 / KCTC 12365 / LMG 23005 / KMM 3901 / M-2Alg 35-1) TaxID=1347342 RepID=T2KRM1_FORAG|nr:YciI family protein [Formosa agariphila]CDF81106.1 phenylalanyl-tRNA synthetase subunit alpha [Formosa agariphila KMM 3901]
MKYIIVLLSFVVVLSCKNETNQTPINTSIKPVDTVEGTVKADSIILDDEIKTAPKSYNEIKAELTAKGFETYDFVDKKTKDTVLMQQYFIAFLKGGAVRTQNEEEAQQLQEAHLDYLKKMYDLGYADISGGFGDDGEVRGVTIYNVPTQKIADSLANADPMVKAGRLEIEIRPWWAAKGATLR